MSKIKSIILKGVKNEKFEKFFCNNNDIINDYKKLSEQQKKSLVENGEGKLKDFTSNNVYYYKTFIPEQKNQSILYIIYCSASVPKERIEECFDEIDELLRKYKRFSLINFPNIIIEGINKIFLRFSNDEEQLELKLINKDTNNHLKKDNNNKLYNNEKSYNSLLIDESRIIESNKVKKNMNYLIKKIKYLYLLFCFIILIFIIFYFRIYLL